MSVLELREQKRIKDITKLYLEESTNEYILEKIVYEELEKKQKSFKYTVWNAVYSYEGYIIIRDKYSPVTMKVSFTDLYKWYSWRNTDFYNARRDFLEEYSKLYSDKIISTNMISFRFSSKIFDKDISNFIKKQIVKTCKDFN